MRLHTAPCLLCISGVSRTWSVVTMASPISSQWEEPEEPIPDSNTLRFRFINLSIGCCYKTCRPKFLWSRRSMRACILVLRGEQTKQTCTSLLYECLLIERCFIMDYYCTQFSVLHSCFDLTLKHYISHLKYTNFQYCTIFHEVTWLRGRVHKTGHRLLPWYGFDNEYSLFRNSSTSWPSSEKQDLREAINITQSVSVILAIFAHIHSPSMCFQP